MNPMPLSKEHLFEKVSFYLLLILSFIIPFFFVPLSAVPLSASKAILVSLAVPLALIVWTLRSLKGGSIYFPQVLTLAAGGILAGVYLLSSLFSQSLSASFFGQGSDIDTFYWFALMFVILVIVPALFKSKGSIFSFYAAFWISALIIALYQGVRIFVGADFLSFGVLTSVASSLVGSWNDLGVYFGLTALLSLVSLHFFSTQGVVRAFSYAALLVSLLFVSIINFAGVWWALLLGSVALIVFFLPVKNLMQGLGAKPNKQSIQHNAPAALVFLVALSFLTIGSFKDDAGLLLRDRIPVYLGASHIDARPSWQGTLNIALDTMKSDPLLGVGPNQFVRQWSLFKPLAVNDTVFWNIDFLFGVGLIPSAFVTMGLVGLIAWLLFIGVFLWEGYRFVRAPQGDWVSEFLSASLFVGAAYLFLLSVFYVPSVAIYTLAFLFAGMFFASLLVSGMLQMRQFTFTASPAISFSSVTALILVLAFSVAALYIGVEKAVSAYYLNSGVLTFNREGDSVKAEKQIRRAVVIGGGEAAQRAYADISLVRLVALVNQTKSTPTDAERAAFQQYLTQALEAAKAAVALNPVNYQNHAVLARVYETLVPLKIPGAYESAKSSYEEALTHYPVNPSLYLQLARLEMINNNSEAAREYIAQALRLKRNYSEAVFLLSQIEVSAGNTRKAIDALNAAAALDANNPALFFQLGLLQYNSKSYREAVAALERAVLLEPSYANAKYFLGLSYYELNRSKDAIAIFESLQAVNTGNQEVSLILSNLRSGRTPFANAKPPVDNKPERRATLPVTEVKPQAQ